MYCGIQLNWDYNNQTVDTSMPGSTKKKLQEYGHIIHKRAQMFPYSPRPKQFGTEAQAPLLPNASLKMDMKGIKPVQQIVESILNYALAIDMTVLIALNSITVEQTKATVKTID
jgi:hypothetical protein